MKVTDATPPLITIVAAEGTFSERNSGSSTVALVLVWIPGSLQRPKDTVAKQSSATAAAVPQRWFQLGLHQVLLRHLIAASCHRRDASGIEQAAVIDSQNIAYESILFNLRCRRHQSLRLLRCRYKRIFVDPLSTSQNILINLFWGSLALRQLRCYLARTVLCILQ